MGAKKEVMAKLIDECGAYLTKKGYKQIIELEFVTTALGRMINPGLTINKDKYKDVSDEYCLAASSLLEKVISPKLSGSPTDQAIMFERLVIFLNTSLFRPKVEAVIMDQVRQQQQKTKIIHPGMS